MTVEELMQAAAQEYAVEQQHVKESVLKAYRCGKLLQEANDRTPHGEWKTVCRQYGFKQSTENERRQLHQRWDEIPDELKRQSVYACVKFLQGQNPKFPKDHHLDPVLKALNDVWAAPCPLQDEDGYAHPHREDQDRHRRSRKMSVILEADRQRPPTYDVFVDSGAFSLQDQARKQSVTLEDYYDSGQHHQYLKDYVAFLQRYGHRFTHYTNLDLIGDPKLTFRNQKFMEEAGLHPVPVVHCGSDLKYLQELLGDHELIAFGGLVAKQDDPACLEWIEDCFDLIHDYEEETNSTVKVHGFGVYKLSVMLRRGWTWHSVDSSRWLQDAGDGRIIVPVKGESGYDFRQEPLRVHVSLARGDREKEERLQLAQQWVQHINVSWDRVSEQVPVKLTNDDKGYKARRRANLLYYRELKQAVPSAPKMYFSGSNTNDPQEVLGPGASFMPTYWEWKKTESQSNSRLDSVLYDTIPEVS